MKICVIGDGIRAIFGDLLVDSECPHSIDCAITILLRAKKIKFFYSLWDKDLAISGPKKMVDFRMKRASLCNGRGTTYSHEV